MIPLTKRLNILKKELESLAKTTGSELRIYNVGSRETCDPPPTDTDFDILVYWKQSGGPTIETLLDLQGYYPQSSDYGDQTDFISYKSKENVINIILTKHLDFEYNFLLATKICKKLNLLDKKDRISVFDGIIKNEWNRL